MEPNEAYKKAESFLTSNFDRGDNGPDIGVAANELANLMQEAFQDGYDEGTKDKVNELKNALFLDTDE